MRSDNSPVLSATSINVNYGVVIAVQAVSLEIGQGEVVGVLGPNGAGKSSLAGAIAGSIKSSGEIRLDGVPIDRLPVHRRVRAGVVLSPEGRGLLGDLSVLDNLLLGTYAAGRVGRGESDRRLSYALDIFPALAQRLQQRASTLSGGEAAMLSIGRALMASPRLLILDEPSLGLAPMIAARLFEQLHLFKQAGQAMLIVEQRAPELMSLADHLVVLRRGEIAAAARPDELTAEQLRDLYFGGGRRGDPLNEYASPRTHTCQPTHN